MNDFLLFWFGCGFIALLINTYRHIMGYPNNDHDPQDSLGWVLTGPVFLVVFIIRYIKYKIKGKRL